MLKHTILDKIYETLERFAVTNEHERAIVTAWVGHVPLLEAFDFTPRLAILSAEKRSGKSRLMELVNALIPNGVYTVSMSPATLYTLAQTKTILHDEIDRLYERRGTDTAEVTALIDAGFRRTGKAHRTRIDKDGKRIPEEFSAFCPFVFGGIDNGRIPDTITDRAIPIRMKRRTENETIEPYSLRDNEPELIALREELVQWAKDNLSKAKESRPRVPSGIIDRQKDIWEPLFTVADVSDVTDVSLQVGYGRWRKKLEAAALWVLTQCKEEEPSTGILLLRDIRDIMEQVYEKIRTETLLERLHKAAESPWSDLNGYGKQLDARGLAKRLAVYGIRPKQIRVEHGTFKGYEIDDFREAWKRYLPKETHPTYSETIETAKHLNVPVTSLQPF